MASSKASSEAYDTEAYVTEALEHLAKLEPEHYAKLKGDTDKMARLRTEMKQTADELLETINNVKQKKSGQVTINEAFRHLPKVRVNKITSSFRNQTFAMSVNTSGGVRRGMANMPDGEEFVAAVTLPSEEASILQKASIILESAIFVLDMIGIHVPQNKKALAEVVEIVKKAMRKAHALINDVDELEKAYRNGSNLGMAKAIIKIAIDLFTEGIFVTVAKSLLSNMSWFDWLITAARIIAFLVTLVATAGAAEIAEIISLLLDVTDFLRKLANLGDFT